jgi:hypothetical protein
MILEGGAGLYSRDITDDGRLIEICPQKTLLLTCVGPADSEWFKNSFQVRLSVASGKSIFA